MGTIVNGTEKIPLAQKKDEIAKRKAPNNIIELRVFLGTVGWFRSFIPRFVQKTKHLTSGLKEKNRWCWTEEIQREFINMKKEITEMQNLTLPDYNKPFIFRTDASNTGLGAVLYQEDEIKCRKPIEWTSRKLTPTEMRYGISEKEMLAVFLAVIKLEYQLRGRKFSLETDHKALLEIINKPFSNYNRINR